MMLGGLICCNKDKEKGHDWYMEEKDKPGLTNIEKNFLDTIQDTPTLTKLCVLAMYNVNVSHSFMQHVCLHDNLLEFGPFFQKKVDFLKAVAVDPKRWLSPDAPHTLGTLNGHKQDSWHSFVMKSIHSLMPHLLEGMLVAFLKGAKKAFSKRFSDEFVKGGDIYKLATEDCVELYFASTNDVNEGGLGSWHLEQ
ncbi:hypothetical protein BYT27DRAFT_7217789 [Phlegmacium glaucopus]|nr:hypothetical protein BYT27DRAFT_7217789 [Phlegmacium glaucopus]